jgi:uncharacterized OB-fold protein
MLEMLRSVLLGGKRSEVVTECRNCGTPVEPNARDCPTCGAADLVRYEID